MTEETRESRMVTLRTDAAGKPAVWCDPEIADLVDALNTEALGTIASCSGHGHRPGCITLRDGRHLMVFESQEHAFPAESAYQLDVNGAPSPRTPHAHIADYLIDQRDEPFSDGKYAQESKRTHYWRDKAISAGNCLRILAPPQQGEGSHSDLIAARMGAEFVARSPTEPEGMVDEDMVAHIQAAWDSVESLAETLEAQLSALDVPRPLRMAMFLETLQAMAG